MPMKRVAREESLSKSEFHKRLREWLEKTDEAMIGPEDADGRTTWIYVHDGSAIFGLHSDTRRAAVEWYLGKVSLYGDDLLWSVTTSQRGHETAVAHGPEKERNKSFYLYVVSSAPH